MPATLPLAGTAREMLADGDVGCERHSRLAAAADCAVRHVAGDRITALALCLSVAGWSLIWARALALVALVPVWAAILVFLLGLALIPFRPPARRADM